MFPPPARPEGEYPSCPILPPDPHPITRGQRNVNVDDITPPTYYAADAVPALARASLSGGVHGDHRDAADLRRRAPRLFQAVHVVTQLHDRRVDALLHLVPVPRRSGKS
jgi:hypothetical protein